MLYKNYLKDWLVNQKIYLKYSTYTNYNNIIHNQIAPHLGEYDMDIINNDILQQFILDQLDHGRVDGNVGISQKYAKDIITVLKLTLDQKIEIQLPYVPREVKDIHLLCSPFPYAYNIIRLHNIEWLRISSFRC